MSKLLYTCNYFSLCLKSLKLAVHKSPEKINNLFFGDISKKDLIFSVRALRAYK